MFVVNNFYYVRNCLIINYCVTIFRAKFLDIVTLNFLPTSCFHYDSEEKSKKFPIPKMKLNKTDTSFLEKVWRIWRNGRFLKIFLFFLCHWLIFIWWLQMKGRCHASNLACFARILNISDIAIHKRLLKFKFPCNFKFKFDWVHWKMLNCTHLNVKWINYVRDTKQQS